VYGRTAWYQTSDWNLLFVPTGLQSADDVFAVEAAVYVPTLTTYSRGASLLAFTSATGSGAVAGGVQAFLESPLAAPSHLSFHTVTTFLAGIMQASSTLPLQTGQWRQFRLEGLRSTCSFRTLLDGVAYNGWSGTCDLSGTYFALFGNTNPTFNAAQVAWSNLTIFKGSSAACVP
jgi:hypothetical protein